MMKQTFSPEISKLLQRVLLGILLVNFVAADGVTIIGDSNSLDYVNFNYQSRHKLQNEEGDITWTIGKVSCLQLQPGCICDMRENEASFSNSVICTCSDSDQVVNLKGTDRKQSSNIANETWSWTIQSCSKVILHQNFLSSFFKSSSGGLNVEFKNISSLILQESAFTFDDSGSSSYKKNILFNDCGIENVPTKSFPSPLNSLKFLNCTIGTISSYFIQALRMDKIIFDSTNVNEIESEAFYGHSLIDSLLAQNSRFKRIRSKAVASALQHLTWTDCVIDQIDTHGMNGPVDDLRIERSTMNLIETNGLSISSWTTISLVNNTFKEIMHHAIDLTGHNEAPSDNQKPVTLIGNKWINARKDFILTGTTDKAFVTVRDNTFERICSCETTFTSLLTLEGSRSWFHDEMFKSSQCQIDDRSRNCLIYENRSLENGYISYNDLSLLCSQEIFMCLSEVSDVPLSPKFPQSLRILAYIVGGFTLLIVISILITMIVCMMFRKKSPGKATEGNENGNGISNDLPRKEFVKSINPDQYAAISQKVPRTLSIPSRVALLEDVEMEDKGVQTMPTELSADIIEGLREKLSKPDSFWDAKQTIDHLYDLINVREQAVAVSSPPDVTVCNENSETPAPSNSNSRTHQSNDSLKLLISPSRRSTKIMSSNNRGEARKSMSTFAQVPSPSQSTIPICDYRDPSDPQVHIYSELVARQGINGKLAHIFAPKLKSQPTSPIVCEYTEPRDFNAHIYAELSNNPRNSTGCSSPTKASQTQTNFNPNLTEFLCVNEIEGSIMQFPTTPSSVIPPLSPQRNLYSSKLNDLNSERDCPSNISKTNNAMNTLDESTSNNIPTSMATIPSQTKRPLPSIPSPSISTHL